MMTPSARRLANRPSRDLEKAVHQVVDCLRRQMGAMAPDQPPEWVTKTCQKAALLTENNLLNVARHIVMCIDEYGRRR